MILSVKQQLKNAATAEEVNAILAEQEYKTMLEKEHAENYLKRSCSASMENGKANIQFIRNNVCAKCTRDFACDSCPTQNGILLIEAQLKNLRS